ncbi:hypothetical protein [Dyadobacter diqingensis]|uniref:hypothetical protein n=1 Tax=Dyadobacter diqingensis TaxID=2938121 RepID=UPI0020C306AE|nr:hypothetical protein [Dyadobacter diqingensis]
MKTTDQEIENALLGDAEMLDKVPDIIEPWDPDEDRKNDPEHEYMRSLLYDARRWKKFGHPEFEKRVLIVLKDFLHEHIQML